MAGPSPTASNPAPGPQVGSSDGVLAWGQSHKARACSGKGLRAGAGPQLGLGAGRALSMVPARVCEAGAQARGPGGPSPLPTLWATPSPLVVGGEDTAARRVVAVLGLPGASGATLVLAVGGGGRHGAAGVWRQPPKKGGKAAGEVGGAVH